MTSPIPNESGRLPTTTAPPFDAEVRWTLSRHARRLLTLAAAGLFVAVLTRRAEFAGLAAPALLLLGAGRPSRPPVRKRLP